MDGILIHCLISGKNPWVQLLFFNMLFGKPILVLTRKCLIIMFKTGLSMEKLWKVFYSIKQTMEAYHTEEKK
jgi:hypothetical protein